MDKDFVVVKVVLDDGTPLTPEEIELERQRIVSEGKTPIVPGSKTDSALLLDSLKKERETRRALETENQSLKTTPPPAGSTPHPSAEDTQALNARIEALEKEGARKDLFLEFPELKDHSVEFEKYLADPENIGMSMKTAARAFLVENGLSGTRRMGLEKPTGGDRQPPATGMTVEDIKVLRETNFKKYTELLEKGLIKVPS